MGGGKLERAACAAVAIMPAGVVLPRGGLDCPVCWKRKQRGKMMLVKGAGGIVVAEVLDIGGFRSATYQETRRDLCQARGNPTYMVGPAARASPASSQTSRGASQLAPSQSQRASQGFGFASQDSSAVVCEPAGQAHAAEDGGCGSEDSAGGGGSDSDDAPTTGSAGKKGGASKNIHPHLVPMDTALIDDPAGLWLRSRRKGVATRYLEDMHALFLLNCPLSTRCRADQLREWWRVSRKCGDAADAVRAMGEAGRGSQSRWERRTIEMCFAWRFVVFSRSKDFPEAIRGTISSIDLNTLDLFGAGMVSARLDSFRKRVAAAHPYRPGEINATVSDGGAKISRPLCAYVGPDGTHCGQPPAGHGQFCEQHRNEVKTKEPASWEALPADWQARTTFIGGRKQGRNGKPTTYTIAIDGMQTRYRIPKDKIPAELQTKKMASIRFEWDQFPLDGGPMVAELAPGLFPPEEVETVRAFANAFQKADDCKKEMSFLPWIVDIGKSSTTLKTVATSRGYDVVTQIAKGAADEHEKDAGALRQAVAAIVLAAKVYEDSGEAWGPPADVLKQEDLKQLAKDIGASYAGRKVDIWNRIADAAGELNAPEILASNMATGSAPSVEKGEDRENGHREDEEAGGRGDDGAPPGKPGSGIGGPSFSARVAAPSGALKVKKEAGKEAGGPLFNTPGGRGAGAAVLGGGASGKSRGTDRSGGARRGDRSSYQSAAVQSAFEREIFGRLSPAQRHALEVVAGRANLQRKAQGTGAAEVPGAVRTQMEELFVDGEGDGADYIFGSGGTLFGEDGGEELGGGPAGVASAFNIRNRWEVSRKAPTEFEKALLLAREKFREVMESAEFLKTHQRRWRRPCGVQNL
eukprot:g20314.t1